MEAVAWHRGRFGGLREGRRRGALEGGRLRWFALRRRGFGRFCFRERRRGRERSFRVQSRGGERWIGLQCPGGVRSAHLCVLKALLAHLKRFYVPLSRRNYAPNARASRRGY